MSLSNNMGCIYVENKTMNIGDNQESNTVTKLRHSEEHASIFLCIQSLHDPQILFIILE